MRFKPGDFFTLFIIVVLAIAVYVASSWELRASIIVLVLGSFGLVMATAQLAMDLRGGNTAPKPKLQYELPSFEDADPRATLWGSLEIWAWLIGLVVAIQIIGLPLSLPLFVVVYGRAYGAGWGISTFLGLLIAAFIFGVYMQIMHVYWPETLLGNLLGVLPNTFLGDLLGIS